MHRQFIYCLSKKAWFVFAHKIIIIFTNLKLTFLLYTHNSPQQSMYVLLHLCIFFTLTRFMHRPRQLNIESFSKTSNLLIFRLNSTVYTQLNSTIYVCAPGRSSKVKMILLKINDMNSTEKRQHFNISKTYVLNSPKKNHTTKLLSANHYQNDSREPDFPPPPCSPPARHPDF